MMPMKEKHLFLNIVKWLNLQNFSKKKFIPIFFSFTLDNENKENNLKFYILFVFIKLKLHHLYKITITL